MFLIRFLKRIVVFLCRLSSWKKIGFVLLFVLPIVVYIVKFYDHPISDNPSDWADFGSYVGGVYTLLVTIFAIYITRHLEKIDLEWRKAKEAVGSIYEQISIIDYQNVNMKLVNKLLSLTNQNELYLPIDVYNKLIELYDDYIVAKEDPQKFDVKKVIKIKRRLKRLYDL